MRINGVNAVFQFFGAFLSSRVVCVISGVFHLFGFVFGSVFIGRVTGGEANHTGG